MLCHSRPTGPPDYAACEIPDAIALQPGLLLCDPPAQYRPRHPEKAAVCLLFQDHFDDYVQTYEERFESRSGPLRAAVVHSVEQFLTCWVIAFQSFGACGANFNPHLHAIVSDGVFTREGEFLPLPSLDASTVMELFRHLLLKRLHQAERLSERFRDQLLSWAHLPQAGCPTGFSDFAGPAVEGSAAASLESQARYMTRPALAMDALESGKLLN